MSTLHSQTDWTKIKQENLDSKYEKCRNITEEIYKRINLTFQVKKLENQPQSELSERYLFILRQTFFFISKNIQLYVWFSLN